MHATRALSFTCDLGSLAALLIGAVSFLALNGF
jgi:hypothetical protein